MCGYTLDGVRKTLTHWAQLSVEQIGVLYKLGRFQYTIGQYQAAADYLYHFRVLTIDPELESSAMWGKLASNILEGAWDAALNELDLIRKHVDALYPATSASANAVVGLQQRTWFLHWSLYVYFNHPEGREKLIDAWMSQTLLPSSANRDGRDQQAYLQTYLPTLQANAPWLMRYLVAAVVLSKRAAFKGNAYLGPMARITTREQLGTAVLLAIKQESYQYADPVTDFIRCLFADLDFKTAGEMLAKSEQVVANDFFLSEFKDEWKERARYLYSEAYCRIHNQIDIGCVGPSPSSFEGC
jgi:translation initiation factor 3 subunit E